MYFLTLGIRRLFAILGMNCILDSTEKERDVITEEMNSSLMAHFLVLFMTDTTLIGLFFYHSY